MKLVITVLCLVAVVVATPDNRGLTQDLDDFIALIPVEDIAGLALRYIVSDKEVQSAFLYLQSEEFSAVWDQFFAVAEVTSVLDYLEEAGVPAYDTLNKVAEFLGLNHVSPVVIVSWRSGGLKGLIDEVLALLPHNELRALFEDKLKTSAEFKALFEKLQHADFHQLLDLYNSSIEVQAFVQKLREHGIDIEQIIEAIKGFFGWTRN